MFLFSENSSLHPTLAYEWCRQLLQALAVIEYLVAHGSERAVDDIIEHTFQISVTMFLKFSLRCCSTLKRLLVLFYFVFCLCWIVALEF